VSSAGKASKARWRSRWSRSPQQPDEARIAAAIEAADDATRYRRLAGEARRAGDLEAAEMALDLAARAGALGAVWRLQARWLRAHRRMRRGVAEALGALARRRPRLRTAGFLGAIVRRRRALGALEGARTLVEAAAASHPDDARLAALAAEVTAELEVAPPGSTRRRSPGAGRGAAWGDEQRVLADFLYYGYLPSRDAAEEAAAAYRGLLADDGVAVFDPGDHASVHRLLLTVVGDALAAAPSERYLIGVSSGYDSRTLLGALAELVGPERVVAFTTGHPGNADFDLAPIYAAGAVAEHRVYDVNDGLEPSIEAMARQARATPAGMPRALRMPRAARTRGEQGRADAWGEGGSSAIWSLPRLHGFLGGLSGSWLKGRLDADFEASKRAFLLRQARFVKPRHHERFFPASYDPAHVLPAEPLLPAAQMSYVDQLNLCYRQHQLTRTLSSHGYSAAELRQLSGAARRGFERKGDLLLTPFADPRWQRSMLQVPLERRVGQALLLEVVRERYPSVFPDLVDPHDPRFVVERKPTVNSSWEHVYERDGSFRALVWSLLVALRQRRLWFDPLEAIDLAEERAPSYAVLLQGLCSLEMHIRAGNLPDP